MISGHALRSWLSLACDRRSWRGLMSQLASYAALAALFDCTLRCQNRPRQLRRAQAGGWRAEFQSEQASIVGGSYCGRS
jgi:hypothetical protein